MKRVIVFMLLLLAGFNAQAAIEAHEFNTPEQAKLYNQMIDELRCLVCQNQNLSASNAALAQDLRRQTYSMVIGGKTHDQIVDYMTRRYGDFVMYRPPLKATTMVLWFGPFVLLFFALSLLVMVISKENRNIRLTMEANMARLAGGRH